MAEEPNPTSQKIIKMEGTAKDQSKLTQVGSIEAKNFNFTTEQLQIIVQLESINKPESPGVLKAGYPPKRSSSWQGRKTEYAQIQQWLTDKNTFLIGIEGIGGMGKSMLAAKIYDEIEGFPKRFWADVSYGAGFSDLARQVLREFGFPVPEQEAQLVEALVKCLRSGQYLLIIDNLESLLQPNRQWGSLFYGDFFNAWVEYGGNSKVLVTTRERPELKGFEWLPLKGLQVEEGVALLTELGIRGNLAEFVELVDGHPLLLRLVADLLKEEYSQDRDLRRLADLGLGNLRQLLTDPQVVGVHRQPNVGIVLVLDASFERLSELQKTLLLNISVYRGAFDSAAAVAVLPESSQTEIEGELRNLVKRSLLLSEKLNGKPRFEFQSVVLEYARYKAGDQTEAHERAIDYYHSNLKQEPWQTKQDIKEYLEIFYHCCQLENYDTAFDIFIKCDNFLTFQGYYTILIDFCVQLREAWRKTGEKETWKYGFVLNELGNASQCLGQYEQAINYHQQSLEIKKKIGDRNGEVDSLGNLGNCYNSLTEYPRAINYYEQSLLIAKEINDRNGESNSLNNLGNTYTSLEDYSNGIDHYEQSLLIKMELGDRNGESNCLNNLGVVNRILEQYQQAIEYFQRSLQIQSELGESKMGERRVEANAWLNLGGALVSANRESDALGAYRNARELYQAMELEKEVKLCNNAIERLSQPKTPVVSRRGFWVWLRRLWRWVRSWFRR
ncbi:MAG: tetratricopeptide repeat protein [Nostoc sp.]|uniref:tetratricopeptide repeat protein n=1 Tax=Nostoc sp. TaxID=1180 RepID=UPI002FF4D59A